MRTSIIFLIIIFAVICCKNSPINIIDVPSDSLVKTDTINNNQTLTKEVVNSSIRLIDNGFQKNAVDTFSFAKFRLNENDAIEWHRKDSTIYHYKNYYISTVSNDGEIGEEIVIYYHNSGSGFSYNKFCNCGAAYFSGIFNDHLIIDEGTSATRGLSVFNLITKTIVLNATYINEMDIQNNEIKFLGVVNGHQSNTIHCQEGELYEEFVFNLLDKSLKKTGKFDCIIGE
jgi:hypothetical protein